MTNIIRARLVCLVMDMHIILLLPIRVCTLTSRSLVSVRESTCRQWAKCVYITLIIIRLISLSNPRCVYRDGRKFCYNAIARGLRLCLRMSLQRIASSLVAFFSTCNVITKYHSEQLWVPDGIWDEEVQATKAKVIMDYNAYRCHMAHAVWPNRGRARRYCLRFTN